MGNKDRILRAAMELLEEKGENPDAITVRDICRKADVGLGLVNYHFGNKDRLMEAAVECIVGKIITQFQDMEETMQKASPYETLLFLGNLTFDFLFAHAAVARISILGDLRSPKAGDNTHRTYQCYLPLVSACRPDWDEQTVKEKTFVLITVMQQSFLRRDIITAILGFDFSCEDGRHRYHKKILNDILEIES